MTSTVHRAPLPQGYATIFTLKCLAAWIAILCAGESMAAQVTLSNLTHTYNNSPKSATVTTVPAGLAVTVTYAGSSTPPTNAGNYAVVATVVDPADPGSATGTLVISKANQVITFGALPAKTYGDAPFAVSATTNSGLPITRWESNDPAVATISAGGQISLVGAGQTSIIAIFDGNANYNDDWLARPLNVARSLAALPSGTRVVTYNGGAQTLDANTLPSGQASEITYRDTSVGEATATPQVVFQNSPDLLNLSYISAGFEAGRYWGMAKMIGLGGTARKLESCDVVLVSWARYDTSSPYGYQSSPWVSANPQLVVPPKPGATAGTVISVPGDSGGYYHPVTLSFYTYDNDGVTESQRLLTSQTVQAFIPWRPANLSDGVTSYTNFGYAFRVPFTFPDGVILPEEVWVAVSLNTNNSGTAKIGVPGPYDALNLARPDSPGTSVSVGATIDSDAIFYRDWRWQYAIGTIQPMLRLRAVPTTASLATPVHAGTYEVKTKAAAFGDSGSSTSTLLVSKAPVQINLSNLIQVRDGDPKPIAVSTSPPGVSTSVSYAGSPTAPSALGRYLVDVISTNPNYEGQATDALQIGDNFGSWQAESFKNSGLPSEQKIDTADPDGDGLSNFMEYASNLNPLLGNHPSPVGFEANGDNLSFTYRRNLHALDLEYSLQDTTNLTDPASWSTVSPLSETTVSDDGSTRVIRAALAKPADTPSYFLRLKANR